MDKSWIKLPRTTAAYMSGLDKFLEFAFTHSAVDGKIVCPCSKCDFRKWQTKEEAKVHLLQKPFPPDYTWWQMHGEPVPMMNDYRCAISQVGVRKKDGIGLVNQGVHDTFGAHNNDKDNASSQVGVRKEDGISLVNQGVRGAFGAHNNDKDNMNKEGQGSNPANKSVQEFLKLMKESDNPLYPGCEKYSKLSFLVQLNHIKCSNGMTDEAMSMILELLQDAFPNANVPTMFNETKKIANDCTNGVDGANGDDGHTPSNIKKRRHGFVRNEETPENLEIVPVTGESSKAESSKAKRGSEAKDKDPFQMHLIAEKMDIIAGVLSEGNKVFKERYAPPISGQEILKMINECGCEKEKIPRIYNFLMSDVAKLRAVLQCPPSLRKAVIMDLVSSS